MVRWLDSQALSEERSVPANLSWEVLVRLRGVLAAHEKKALLDKLEELTESFSRNLAAEVSIVGLMHRSPSLRESSRRGEMNSGPNCVG